MVVDDRKLMYTIGLPPLTAISATSTQIPSLHADR
jgi:hypothetical protein